MKDTKEKAKELVEEFRLNVVDYEGNGINGHKAKQCALITINRILQTFSISWLWCSIDMKDKALWNKEFEFWQEVKNEIEKL